MSGRFLPGCAPGSVSITRDANSILQPSIRRGMRPPKVRFAADSSLEGDGFEPSVPREKHGEKAKESISHKTASAEGSSPLPHSSPLLLHRNPTRDSDGSALPYRARSQ